MLNHLEKHRLLISIVLTTGTLATLFLWPAYSRPISTGILLMSMSTAVAFIAQKHRQAYDQAECTREKMKRNLSLDVVGLLSSQVLQRRDRVVDVPDGAIELLAGVLLRLADLPHQ